MSWIVWMLFFRCTYNHVNKMFKSKVVAKDDEKVAWSWSFNSTGKRFLFRIHQIKNIKFSVKSGNGRTWWLTISSSLAMLPSLIFSTSAVSNFFRNSGSLSRTWTTSCKYLEKQRNTQKNLLKSWKTWGRSVSSNQFGVYLAKEIMANTNSDTNCNAFL